MERCDREALVARLSLVSASTDGCRIRRDPEAGILCYESRSTDIEEYCDFCAVLCARAELDPTNPTGVVVS